ncbi:Rhodanese-related sulfurtransferase [Terriglobus roseus]|uniref:Rhodanese-related sulfurtransferase n=1 Tax=Terriglobus roseus TaxID=392734 RepID=A0A1H4SR13_9BACT|nr:Rhodanese-related sulfurtransferase [Terriglobus roseus]
MPHRQKKFAYANCVLPYEISVAEVAQLRAAGTPFTLLDVREPWEVATASIAGSLDVPMGEIPARANQALDPDAHIVVVCHHGARSLSVTAWLRREGFDRAQSMAGGINQWTREIDPKVPLY